MTEPKPKAPEVSDTEKATPDADTVTLPDLDVNEMLGNAA